MTEPKPPYIVLGHTCPHCWKSLKLWPNREDEIKRHAPTILHALGMALFDADITPEYQEALLDAVAWVEQFTASTPDKPTSDAKV